MPRVHLCLFMMYHHRSKYMTIFSLEYYEACSKLRLAGIKLLYRSSSNLFFIQLIVCFSFRIKTLEDHETKFGVFSEDKETIWKTLLCQSNQVKAIGREREYLFNKPSISHLFAMLLFPLFYASTFSR